MAQQAWRHMHADCQCAAWVRQEVLALIQQEGAPRDR